MLQSTNCPVTISRSILLHNHRGISFTGTTTGRGVRWPIRLPPAREGRAFVHERLDLFFLLSLFRGLVTLECEVGFGMFSLVFLFWQSYVTYTNKPMGYLDMAINISSNIVIFTCFEELHSLPKNVLLNLIKHQWLFWPYRNLAPLSSKIDPPEISKRFWLSSTEGLAEDRPPIKKESPPPQKKMKI